MTVEAIDHVNIRTADVPGTCRFFAEVLGMNVTDTPGLPDRTQAAWIRDAEGRAVIHVASSSINYPWESESSAEPPGSGRIHHVALRCSGHAALLERFAASGIGWHATEIPSIGLRQLFITEPNGITLELNFFGD